MLGPQNKYAISVHTTRYEKVEWTHSRLDLIPENIEQS